MENKTETEIIITKFCQSALNCDLSSIPGMTEKAKTKCELNGIKTTDHLIGNFFLLDRDERKFIEFLQLLEFSERDARLCAYAMVRKFGSF